MSFGSKLDKCDMQQGMGKGNSLSVGGLVVTLSSRLGCVPINCLNKR